MAQWDFDNAYKLTSPYGFRMHPVQKVLKFHRGVDLVVTPGNGPLYAFVEGEVTHAKMGAAGSGIPSEMGIVVAIRDSKGYLHLYAHLSMASVKVGQKVLRGSMIGRQGTTGVDAAGNRTSTGNHLHYEIRKRATPSFGWTPTEDGTVEPTAYLQAYYKPAPVKPVKEDDDMPKLPLSTANTLIKILKKEWETATPASRVEIHNMANDVRASAGLPKE